MDLRIYMSVLWRFKWLVTLGLVAASTLALLAVVRVSLDGDSTLTYRQQEQWMSTSRVFVTQEGFPWGRSVVPGDALAPAEGSEPADETRFAPPERLVGLAALYAQLATTDPVLRLVPRELRQRGLVTAAPVVVENVPLPMVDIAATAHSAVEARVLGQRAAAALQEYVEGQQDANEIAPGERVSLQIVNRPDYALLVQGRSLTRPIMVFAAVVLVFVGMAFVLENLRPRVRPSAAELVPASRAAERRTA